MQIVLYFKRTGGDDKLRIEILGPPEAVEKLVSIIRRALFGGVEKWEEM